MADAIAKRDRALIDAFPAGRIKRIPTGTSGHPGFIWRPTGVDGGSLVSLADEGWKGVWHRLRKRVEARREVVLRMTLEGKTRTEIARATGWSKSTVGDDVAELRNMGRLG